MSRSVFLHRPNVVEAEKVTVSKETTFFDLLPKEKSPSDSRITLGKVNHVLYELGEEIPEVGEEILFINTQDTDGYRVYMRTLSFVFSVAMKELFPENRLVFEHSISGGTYCTLRDGDRPIVMDSWTRDRILTRMRKIVEEKIPIVRREVPVSEAISLFENLGRMDKVALLKQTEKDRVAIYSMGEHQDSFFGFLLPNTELVDVFDLELFNCGLVLLGVDRFAGDRVRNFLPQYKLSMSYNESEAWAELQGVTQVSHLNALIEQGRIGEVCRVTESLQNEKIMDIAEEIHRNNKRIVLIAAPSSSGKTSFTYKLKTKLKVLGLRPLTISLDDYYVNRVDTPLDEHGNYDFESIYAIDLELFNKDLNALMRGEPVERIRFDFTTGERVHMGEEIQIGARDPILIEGIHGLNPLLTDHIAEEHKYRIYLSVITQINLDNHNRIPTTDLRILRRMARDKAFRGKPIDQTIMEWESVRAGEKEFIFPYQEEADVLFNSSFIFEIPILKKILMKELKEISPENPAYTEAKRLESLLQYFVTLEDDSDVVNTSILREFIGGSKIV